MHRQACKMPTVRFRTPASPVTMANSEDDFNAANDAVTHAQSDLDHGSFLQRAALVCTNHEVNYSISN
jgi:nitrite reductase/ring-hydroxylating ferredoxin subunit